MVSSKSLISTAFAGLALATVASAQNNQMTFQKVDGPTGQVHYDLATGKVTKVIRPRQVSTVAQATPTQAGIQRAGVNSFNNTLTTGYFTTVSLGAEWIDWAEKASANDTFMTAFTFGYGTVQADTSNGGTGANLELSFYTGTAGGGGVCTLGTEIGRSIFAGLPGATASVPPGFGVAFNVTAFLQQGLCVPNGQIGWGYTGEDSDGLGGSNTGPRMTDFGTNTGWRDSFQWYANPASLNTCVGTFWFGGCSTGNVPPAGTGGTPCTSFLLGITEYAPVVTASCAFRNTTNPANLVVLSPPVIGGSFAATTLALIAGYAVTAGPLPGIPLTGAVNGSLLCDPTTIFGGIQVGVGGIVNPLPKDQGLEGVGVCVQAAEFNGPGNFGLTNAFDCTIGG